jgi:hypothetical protein
MKNAKELYEYSKEVFQAEKERAASALQSINLETLALLAACEIPRCRSSNALVLPGYRRLNRPTLLQHCNVSLSPLIRSLDRQKGFVTQ